MGNNICPVCGDKAEGKAVRRINFCKLHRELAIFLRDSEEIKKHEQSLGMTLWDSDFARMVTSFIRKANPILQEQGLRIVGT